MCEIEIKKTQPVLDRILPRLIVLLFSPPTHNSFERGAKQKVVAFSFYGNPLSAQSKERKYFEGIRANLNELPKHYPDWTLRLYYDLPKDHYLMKELCDLACNDPNLDLCYVEQIPALGNVSKAFAMNW